MDMTGEYRIPAPRQRVWEALNDPEILRAAVPGCDELVKKSDTELEAKVTAKVGDTVTWNFGGDKPHSVTVANGPRGFSSVYWGQTAGSYSVKPTVKGTYKLVCLVHPTTMAQTLEVK